MSSTRVGLRVTRVENDGSCVVANGQHKIFELVMEFRPIEPCAGQFGFHLKDAIEILNRLRILTLCSIMPCPREKGFPIFGIQLNRAIQKKDGRFKRDPRLFTLAQESPA